MRSSSENLEYLLLTHTISEQQIAFDNLDCDGILTMTNDEQTSILCNGDGDKFIIGAGNDDGGDGANKIVASDVEACNGIIHIVDGVIMPDHTPVQAIPPTFTPVETPSSSSSSSYYYAKPTPKPTPMTYYEPQPTPKPTPMPYYEKPTERPTRKKFNRNNELLIDANSLCSHNLDFPFSLTRLHLL
jgi:cell division septation protein DedD